MEELKAREIEGEGETERGEESEEESGEEESEEDEEEEREEEEKEITHPYHLQHPLTLTLLNTASQINNTIQTQSPSIFDRCGWCKNNPDTRVYNCSVCSFCLCLPCSRKKPLLTIPSPKSHHHSLSFLPRPLLHPCDACGLITPSETSYACFQCNYMVHESCINLPRVIKLTRHPHRLILSPYLPPAVVLCRVCYKAVDTRYGQYSCIENYCSYVIHSKCATHPEVWNKKEVKWKLEYRRQIEGAELFTKVDDELILYFGHQQHHLKLSKCNGHVRGEEMLCQACILPIRSERFYSCMECNYYLHQECVSPPTRLDHLLHRHRLVLNPNPQGKYDCSTCSRKSSGFLYECFKPCCKTRMCHIDLQCISLPHCFTHKSHEHPLFTSVSYGLDDGILCAICKKGCERAVVLCTVCDYVMCFSCATIPTEFYYKYDKHPLSLCYGELSADVGIYWCEVCEKQIMSSKWFYNCNQCCVTIHLECLFGPSIYMKPGSTFDEDGYEVKVISNNSVNRWLCCMCESRCTGSVCFRVSDDHDYDFCSFFCLRSALQQILLEEM